MLTQWFDPETGPAALPGIYAREFVRQGHEVRVLTGFPNYPDGRLYSGYRLRARARERHEQVDVTRVALYPSHSRSAVGRLVNYASFGVSASTLGAGSLRGSDALWVYNSPITVSLPQLAHSRLGRIPVFLHVQDLWPDSLVESGMFPRGGVGGVAARVVAAAVRFTERRSAVIGVISPTVRDVILERNPRLDPSRIVYVPNPANELLFRPAPLVRTENGVTRASDAFMVMYAGAIGEVQGLDTLLDAAERVKDRADITFALVGDGIRRSLLEREAVYRGLTNVRFMGRVPQSLMPDLMARADLQMVSLAGSPFLAYTTPSKIATLLASELPILAQLDGDGANLLRASGAAEVVHPGDADGLASAVIRLADAGEEVLAAMARAGREYYDQHLSAASAAAAIVRSLRALGFSKEDR